MNVPLNIDWQQILLHAFNFAILAAGLIILLYRPIRKFMKKREEGYKAAAEKAEKERNEAIKLEKDIAARKAAVDEEVEAYRAAAVKQANDEAETRLSEAKKRAEGIMPAATSAAEAKKKEIIDSSEDAITDMVITASEKLASYSATPATDSNIYDRFIETAAEQEDKKDD